MTCPNCRYYDPSKGCGCDAPLCPKDPQSVANGCWFADEPICRLLRNVPDWVRTQRALAKRLTEAAGYFTVKMLKAVRHPSRISCGADPEAVPAAAEKRWFREHGKGKKRGSTVRAIRGEGVAQSRLHAAPEAAPSQESRGTAAA